MSDCRDEYVKRGEHRLKESGREGREKLHHGSVRPEDWEPALREYWGAVLDCVIGTWTE